MAEEQEEDVAAEEGGEDGQDEKSGGKKKLIIFGLAGLLLLGVAGGAGAYFMGFFDSAPSHQAAAVPKPDPVHFYPLDEFTVNIASVDDRIIYLKVDIVLELPDKATAKVIEPMLPRVRDTFQTYLRELRTADFQGSAGLFRLKEELLRRINVAVYPAQVNKVLLNNLLIQ